MNIQEAKQEIIHTLQAYLRKDDAGNYLFPAVHQRPILLMGPPGIGKTAIMEQVARRCGVGLVAYTITTTPARAPLACPILRKNLRRAGHVCHGIYHERDHRFRLRDHGAYRLSGRHPVPGRDQLRFGDAGAHHAAISAEQDLRHAPCPGGLGHRGRGNPPEYNKSVREFDVVTLDRVRQINVEADLDIWLDYAREKQLHGAVISYLSVKRERFYMVKRTEDNLSFVTARGWKTCPRY